MRREIYIFFLALIFLLSSCSPARYEAYPKIPHKKTYAVASWYGPNFNGRLTASGEIFNMYADTCAHKTYPFGTKLKVTNTSNNRSVECTVNDRGPFIKGRDLDLSYAAAKKIGMIGPGTSRVLLEVRGRDNAYIKYIRVQTVKRIGPFAIQVGAFTENINAIRLKRALKLKYSNVYIQKASIKRIEYYRVRIGNFENFDKAVSTAEELGQEGYQALVLKAEVKL